MAKSNERQRLGILVHVGKKHLALDDETYRALLARVSGGKTSSSNLTTEELRLVLSDMRAKGFAPKGTPRPAPAKAETKAPPADKAALTKKLDELLAGAGKTRAYADGIARKMFHVDRVEWLDREQLRRVVTALVYHGKRKGAR